MIAAMLLQLAADAPALPADWSALAPVPYAQAPAITPAYAQFVAAEVSAGRCALARPADGHYVLRVEIATLISPDGVVRRAVPHAIDCPTVEQYATGLVLGFARGNLSPRLDASDLWYRATITFDWRG